MTQLTGYGLVLKCVQRVPSGEDPFYFEGCFLVRKNRLFQLPDEENNISTIIKANSRCNDCHCNQGPVNIFWEELREEGFSCR